MPLVSELMGAHRSCLTRGVVPEPGPAVLVEATRGQEKLLPAAKLRPRSQPWSTRVVDVTGSSIAAHDSARVEQMRSLQSLISDHAQVFFLRKDARNPSTNICIGRAPRNDLVLADQAISTVHAVVEQDDERYFLTDSNSSNGTFVNRRRLDRAESVVLRSGDCVRFGSRVFYFLSGERFSLFLDLRITGGNQSSSQR